MFNNMKEAKPEIPIPNIRYSIFLAMMQFLYTDGVDITLELTLDLLGAATQFSLDLLKSLCERVLEQSISIDNVGKISTFFFLFFCFPWSNALTHSPTLLLSAPIFPLQLGSFKELIDTARLDCGTLASRSLPRISTQFPKRKPSRS
jgi:hypothetical protein